MNLKNITRIILVIFGLVSSVAQAQEQPDVDQPLALSCSDVSWGDIERLVAPYLDEVMYSALVMQGLSAEYKAASAAEQALSSSKTLPSVVKRMLAAVVKADC